MSGTPGTIHFTGTWGREGWGVVACSEGEELWEKYKFEIDKVELSPLKEGEPLKANGGSSSVHIPVT